MRVAPDRLFVSGGAALARWGAQPWQVFHADVPDGERLELTQACDDTRHLVEG